MNAAMQGLRVLDFSMGVAGPHAGMLCAQHGADVVKVESLEGDWARVLGQQYGDLSAFSLIYNRGKRSLSVDLKDALACAAMRQMAAQADVIIEAFRPGVMAKFGLDEVSVRKSNPNVVYLSVTGFGAQGPLSCAPATDAILQAFSGLMYSNKDAQGAPQRIDLVVIDIITGLYAFQAISTALLARQRHGTPGTHIDCSLMKSALALQAGKIVENFIEKGDRASYVPLGVFVTQDGHVSLSVRRDDHFVRLCEALGRGDLLASGRYTSGEQRVARADELLPELRAELARRTTDEVEASLTAAGILHSRINEYSDMLAHEQVQTSEAVRWQHQDGLAMALPIAAIPGAPTLAGTDQAPHLGQHSHAALRSWGIDEDRIAALEARGAIKSHKPGPAAD